MRTHRKTQSAHALLMLAGFLLLPSRARGQEKTLPELLNQAAGLAEKGDNEGAAEVLRRAHRRAAGIEDATERRKKLKSVEARQRRVDSLNKKAQSVREKAAKQLLEIGTAYLEKGWKETALPYLEQAERLWPGLATDKIADARTPKSMPGREGAIGTFFRDAEDYRDPWMIEPEEVVSPEVTDHSVMLVTKTALEGSHRIGFDAFLGEKLGKVGLIFGHDLNWSKQRYFVLEVVQEASRTVVRLLFDRGEGEAMERLGVKILQPTAEERAGWMKLAVELRGDEIIAFFGDAEVLRTETQLAPRPGATGIYISSDSANKAPIRFRNLVVRKL